LSLGLTFAETTLYGNVDQAWNKVTKKSGGNTVSDVTGLASVQMGGGVLGVKGSEDLSGGLKASYTIEIQPPIDEESAAAVWNRQAFVGLSGGFGALRIGKQYSNAFMNTLGMDPGGATGLAGNNAYVIQLAHATGDGPLRQSNGMQYDLPEMLPGLKVGATVVFGEKTSKAGDGNGFNVSYTSGPFYAGYTFDRVKNTGISLLANNDVSSAGSNELTTLSASYDLGVAKVSINNTKMSVDSKSVDNTFVAVSVPFGGNVNVWASMSKGSAYRTIVSANKDHEGFQVGVNYALSKRTVLYAQYGQMELIGVSSATDKFEQTGSAIGVHHSF
jgi:predicted porin